MNGKLLLGFGDSISVFVRAVKILNPIVAHEGPQFGLKKGLDHIAVYLSAGRHLTSPIQRVHMRARTFYREYKVE